MKKNKKKRQSKNRFDPIKKCAKLTAKLPTDAYKLRVVKFKLDENPLQHRVYFLYFDHFLFKNVTKYKEINPML